MPRYRLVVAYDGTDFHGWQKQVRRGPDGEAIHLRTVQGVLEVALAHVVREPVTVLGASRTDAGVHARGQIAVFSTASAMPADRFRPALNAKLPDDVQVLRVAPTTAAFDPIRHAVRKGYRYRLAHGIAAGAPRPLFDRRTTACVAETLDAARMDTAARHLVGEHDFASFTRKHHGRETTVRTVHGCTVVASSARRLRIDVTGGGFLYNMVRIIAGTLVEVGRGRFEPEAIPSILAARDRGAAGPTLPPEGLCLMWIKYGR